MVGLEGSHLVAHGATELLGGLVASGVQQFVVGIQQRSFYVVAERDGRGAELIDMFGADVAVGESCTERW